MNDAGAARRRPVALSAMLLLLAAGFCALAVWQVERLQWKEALIARVASAMVRPPVALAVALAALPRTGPKGWEYRRVALTGRYRARGTVLVAGASTRGSGYWVLAPLIAASGTVFVNRGFVPLGSKPEAVRAATPQHPVAVVGLIRLSEPGGGFLRANRPAADRWYSRDVAQIARTKGLAAEVRFFIDATAETPHRVGGPVAGLTVITFANNHLAYALTWLALALLSGGAAIMLWRGSR